MANRDIHIYHHTAEISSTGLSSGSPSDLSRKIDKLTEVVNALARSVKSQGKSAEDLAKTIPTMTMAFNKSANDMMTATSSIAEGKNNAYYEKKGIKNLSRYDTESATWNASNLTPEQKNAKQYADNLRANMFSTGKLNVASAQAKMNVEGLALQLDNLGKSAKAGAQNMRGFNTFNIAEVLGAAAIAGMSKYGAISSGYEANIANAPGVNLGQATVAKNIAQRNTTASMFSSMIPAATMAGASLGGPLGAGIGLLGSMALSYPIQSYVASMNELEQAKFINQQAANQINLGTGAKPTLKKVTPSVNLWGKLEYYATNDSGQNSPSLIENIKHNAQAARSSDYGHAYYSSNSTYAKLINEGKAYAASTYQALASPESLYRNSSNAKAATMNIANMAQSSSVDLSSMANIISYLDATSNGGISSKLTQSIAGFGGVANLPTGLSNAVNIEQLSSLGPVAAINSQERLAPYGQNVMNAGMAMQTMPALQKLAMGMYLSAFDPGVTLKKFIDDPATSSKFLNSGINMAAGIPALAGERITLNSAIAQQYMSVTPEQAYQHARTGSEAASNGQAGQTVMPDALKAGLAELSSQIASMKNNATNANNITITANNVHIANDVKKLNNPGYSTSQTSNTVSGR